MIYRILNEIESSLRNENFIAALALALTLPDICGKAQYPNEKNGNRYKNWFKEYVGEYEKPPKSNSGPSGAIDDMPYMSDEIVYSLRNSILHQGTPNIDSGKIKEPCCQVTRFTLIVDGAINGGSSSISHDGFINSESRTLEINIVNLCWKLCLAAKAYYECNKEKFVFFEYDLQDRRNGETDILMGLDFLN